MVSGRQPRHELLDPLVNDDLCVYNRTHALALGVIDDSGQVVNGVEVDVL